MQNSNNRILPIGSTFGKYTIVSSLGHGGMGAVYRVEHSILKSFFALKILYPEKANTNSAFVERFIREAQLASQIKHSNLVGVYDVGHDKEFNVYFIVMEYISGGSLRDYLKKNGTVSELNALKIIFQMASALQTASQWKMVHRDIKPDNIMFDSKGNAKLADLGIAKSPDEQQSQRCQLIGTPAYMSPEQIRDSAAVDERADIYSLGIVLIEMLSGKNPQRRSSITETLSSTLARKDFSAEIEALAQKGISKGTCNLIRVMTAPDADKRPRNQQFLVNLVRQAAVDISSASQRPLPRQPETIHRESFLEKFMTHHLMRIAKKTIRLLCFIGIIALLSWLGLKYYKAHPEQIDNLYKRYSLKLQTVPGASITLTNEDNRKKINVISDQQGIAFVKSCVPGKYSASVKCNYFNPMDGFLFEINKDTTINLPELKRQEMVLTLSGIVPGTTLLITDESKQVIFKQDVEKSINMLRRPLLGGCNYFVSAVNEYYHPFELNIFMNNNRQLELSMVLKQGDLIIEDPQHQVTVANLKLTRIIDGKKVALSTLSQGVFSAKALPVTDYQLEVEKKFFYGVSQKITIDKVNNRIILPQLIRKKSPISVISNKPARLQVFKILPADEEKLESEVLLSRLQTQINLEIGYNYHIVAYASSGRKIFEKMISLMDETYKEYMIDEK